MCFVCELFCVVLSGLRLCADVCCVSLRVLKFISIKVWNLFVVYCVMLNGLCVLVCCLCVRLCVLCLKCVV